MPKSSTMLEEGEIRPIPRPDKIVSRMEPPGSNDDPNAKPISDLPPSDMFKKMSADLKEISRRRIKDEEKPAPKSEEAVKTPEPKPDLSTNPEEKSKPKPEPEPAPSPAPRPDDDEVPAVIKSPKAADEFRKLKATLSQQIKARQDEIMGLKKQLDEEKTKVAKSKVEPSELDKQLEILKKEREELTQQLEIVALERSPAFKKRYDSRFGNAIEQAKAAAGEHASKVEALVNVIGKERKALLSPILDELDTPDQLSLVSALNSYDTVRREREEELKNHHEVLKAQQDQNLMETQRQQEVVSAKKQYVLGEVLKAAKAFEAFQPIEGNEEQNKLVREYENDVALFINGNVDDAAVAFMPVLAAEGQYLKQHRVPALEARIKELETTLAKVSGVAASLKDGASSKDDKAATGRAEKAKTFMEAFRENYTGGNLRNLG